MINLMGPSRPKYQGISTSRLRLGGGFEYGELFLTMYRVMAGGEKTVDLNLSSGVPIYTIHTAESGAFSDLIIPLRVRIAGLPLRQTTLTSASQFDRNWFTKTDTPEAWFMVGATLMGFRPTPNASLVAKITYLRIPQISQTSGSPQIDQDWHDLLPLFSAAVLYAKEGKVIEAQDHLQKFLAAVGIEKDPRFMPWQKQDEEQRESDAPAKQPRD